LQQSHARTQKTVHGRSRIQHNHTVHTIIQQTLTHSENNQDTDSNFPVPGKD